MNRVKEKLSFGKKSVYRRIIVYFLALSCMTGLICTGVYQQGHSIIKNEISQVIKERNAAVVNSVYNTCQQIRMMLYQFGSAEEILDLIIYSEKERMGEEYRPGQEIGLIQAAQEPLLMIWKGNSMIADVTLICPAAGRTITTGSSGAVSPEDEELVQYFQENQQSGDLFFRDGRLMVMMEYLLGEYYIYAELTSYALEKGFTEQIENSGNSCFLYNVNLDEGIGVQEAAILELLSGGGWQEAEETPVERNGYLYYVSRISHSDYVSVTCCREKEIYEPLWIFRTFYWVLLAVIVIGAVFFAKGLYNTLHRPLHVLLDGLEEVRNGNLDTEISIRRDDEFQEIYESFNSMTVRLRQLIEKNYRQEILLKKSELKQLQSQIAPHFLYNSFIVLSNRIQAEDYEFAAEFSRELGQYFMFLTRTGKEYIPLSEELAHAGTYARIQEVRFRERICLMLDEPEEEWKQVRVPRLIVQPILENVFKYVVGRSMERVTIHLGFACEASALGIIIENSGEISDEELDRIRQMLGKVDDEIHGMANIHQRLMLIYDGNGGIGLERSGLGGLKVTLKLGKEIAEEKEHVQDPVG